MLRSRTIDIDGPVHYLDYEGPTDGPVFVLLHALGAHHGTWVSLAPRLAERGRVLVPDMPGFGLSPNAGRPATLDNFDTLIDRFIAETTDRPVVLAGNSMGGASAVLHASRHPENVDRLVLLAPAMGATRLYTVDPKLIGIFATTMGPLRGVQALASHLPDLTPERFVTEMIRICVVDPARVSREVIEASLTVARERLADLPGTVDAFVQAARSVTRFVLRPRRYLQIVSSIPARALMVVGTKDKLVPAHLAEPVMSARPDWHLHLMEGAGHMPQIEDPDGLAEVVMAWMDVPPMPRAIAG